MRKRIIGDVQQGSEPPGDWLNVEEHAEVEITSEDAAHPIESALVPGENKGWLWMPQRRCCWLTWDRGISVR